LALQPANSLPGEADAGIPLWCSSQLMRGDFGTFLAKSTKEQKVVVFAKIRCEAESNNKKKEKRRK
jgi:hypothetical protein